MASTPWKEHLDRLPFSMEEKIQILHTLCWRGEEPTQAYFDGAMKAGGEEALVLAFKKVLQESESRPHHVDLRKRVKIYSLQAQGEELVLSGRFIKLSASAFKPWEQGKGFLVPFKEGKADASADFVSSFEELTEGDSYVFDDGSGIVSRVKSLEDFNHSEIAAREEEFGEAMVRELKAKGLADHPVNREDLRLHCRGTVEEQEFDAVVLDGDRQAFVGSSKHAAHGTSEVEAHLRSLRILCERANNTLCYPSYAPFHGRRLGACIHIDNIKDAQQENVKHFCFRKGIGLFQRSGTALAMQPLSYRDPQSIDPGRINVIVRGFKRVAR